MYHTQSNSFSMLFSMPTTNGHSRGAFDAGGDGEMYSFATTTSPSAAAVDCTLSLGTPSTRGDNNHRESSNKNKRSSYMSSFGWNILPSTKQTPTPPPPAATKTHRGGNGGDPLLARRCANCDTTSTPLWRNGPRGPKSLCNACGIRFKKEERRATAAAANVEAQHGSWAQAQKSACYPNSGYGNEFRFMEDDVVGAHHRDSESGGMQFLSWRFNVADRPGLVHDFTR